MPRLEIDGGACLLLALLCLTVPLKWLGAAILAALVHEGCHYLVVSILGGRIHCMKIGPAGAVMEATPLTAVGQLTAVLAGPAGSLLLFVLHPLLPRTAVCALVQGCFNLIPVQPLDGGRALRCLLGMFLPRERADKICDAVKVFLIIVLAAVSVWAFMRGFGDFVSAIPLLLLLRLLRSRKFSCKESNLRVQ